MQIRNDTTGEIDRAHMIGYYETGIGRRFHLYSVPNGWTPVDPHQVDENGDYWTLADWEAYVAHKLAKGEDPTVTAWPCA